MDLGADGNSGYHALERYWSLNCDMYNDQSHGACCDWDGMLKSVGAKTMWILMVVSWNMPFGPRKGGDLRLHQLRSCLQDFYTSGDATENPLFATHRPGIAKVVRQNGVDLPEVSAQEDEIIEWLKSRAAFGRTGRRVSMCRFLSSVAACVEKTPYWCVDEFERT